MTHAENAQNIDNFRTRTLGFAKNEGGLSDRYVALSL